MSQVDELVKAHCPDGVQFKALGDVGTFVRGSGLQKSELKDSGTPAIHYGQIHTHYGTWATQTRSYVADELGERLRKAKPGDLVLATTSEDEEAVAKAVAWLGTADAAVSGDAYIYRHTLVPKFAAYFFQSKQFQAQKRRSITGTKVRRISGDSLAKIRAPVPPVPVQEKVVEIIDSLELTNAELEEELQAEGNARRRQYVHYRNHLLAASDAAVQWQPLREVSVNHDSKRRPVTRSARVPGEIPYYGASGVVDYVSEYIFDGDYLLVSEDGANLLARSSPIAFSIAGKTWVNNHAHVLEFKTYSERRFAEIYLNSVNLSPYVSGGPQPKLNKANLDRIPIPVHPEDELVQIVDLLDRVEELSRDLAEALTAERVARRKQYEYYRERLLTFEEAAA